MNTQTSSESPFVKAVVVKRSTADGVAFLRDEVPIGFAYWVDTETIRDFDWMDTNTGQTTKRTSILVCSSALDEDSMAGFMPLELFRLEPPAETPTVLP